MSGALLVVVAVLIAVGLVGVVLPLLPGALLVAAAIVFWAVVESTTAAWTACGIGLLLIAASQILKYTLPGRRMRDSGVPGSSLLIGAVVGIGGFFVVPVIGLVLGFVAGVYLAELRRLGSTTRAWPSTVVALRAVGLSLAIELLGALAAAGTWVVAELFVT